MRLDPLDVLILRELRADARLSHREVARRVRSTAPTVSARVRALEQLGIVRGYHADVDPAALGEPSADAKKSPLRLATPAQADVPCHQCRGPIHADPVKKTLGGMAHVFCCTHCRDTFEARYRAHASASRASCSAYSAASSRTRSRGGGKRT